MAESSVVAQTVAGITSFAEKNAGALASITESLAPWYGAMYKVGLLIGAFLIIKALVNEVSDSKNKHQQGYHGGTVTMIAGVFLTNLQSLTDMVSNTLFGKDSDVQMLSYQVQSAGSGSFEIYTSFAIAIVVLVGIMGTIRGAIMLSAAKSDARQLGGALTHIIGGVFAINIKAVLAMFGETVGGNMGSFISSNII